MIKKASHAAGKADLSADSGAVPCLPRTGPHKAGCCPLVGLG